MTSPLRTLMVVLLSAAAGPALAQPFAFESDQPIEITADTLEVVQADRTATFSGNVDAVQGELVLSADELRVHYRGDGDEKPATPGSTGTIRRIEARGSVVITSPRETAQGEVGIYDVTGAFVTLEGSVILTRDDNVIRGDRLELDLSTGVSRVVTASPDSEESAPDRRVRAVFVPGEDDGKRRAEPADRERRAGGGSEGKRGGKADDRASPGSGATSLPLPKAKPSGGGSE